jgi:pentatricopeptide repeat protein
MMYNNNETLRWPPASKTIDHQHFHMSVAGIEPDIMTYNMAIRACATPAGTTLNLDMLERAFGLMCQLKSAGVAPDVITYTSLISLCGQAGEASRALATFEEMESAGISPDEPCLTALIQACGSARPEEALKAFDRLVGSLPA